MKLANETVLFLVDRLETAMKCIHRRLLVMDIARDFIRLKNEKAAIQLAIDNCKPGTYDELLKEYGNRFNESLQRIRSISEKDLKKSRSGT